ncbi:MAG: imidazole glycerol phosphate synthase subunit HisF [Proteobacteria bacterium]|nr:imidazole glycerol phosphate synthase subunit HisF [Pseudomonadota bacterium]MBU1687973.1 imidazole glycerol phosphate synthase subunit HisF [Pseudomonadota bacterium]
MISLLDYGAGNVRSVRNAIRKLGFEVRDVTNPDDILQADKLVFPGVGSFGSAMERLHAKGFVEPLIARIKANKPFLGICLGLQTLFEGSEESLGVKGLGVIPGMVGKFDEKRMSVPQIGWNGINIRRKSSLFDGFENQKLYFVHSFRAAMTPENREWVLTTTDYGEEFVSGVQKGNVVAFQFHPEKSGEAGLNLLKNFLSIPELATDSGAELLPVPAGTRLAKRIIACLDVRTNDQGDLVVTKGDQYDVREGGEVRNLGKPVELAGRYYDEGADEVTFLNITAFRDFPLRDQPMIEVLQRTSENVFVPLTIGGGIREYTASDGVHYTSLDVASEYFRSGADKISIGSDAVLAVEEYLKIGTKTGKTSLEQISRVYGNQAVVVSVDPRRVYVTLPDETSHHVIETKFPGPNGERYCWYQCTIKGGREGRDLDVVQLVTVCEKLGAGEILLNCMDKDGTNSGYDLELITMVKEQVTIPVIASSGAGKVEHFSEVFEATNADAALAAGIFHRKEVPIEAVKKHLQEEGIEIR